MILIISKIFLIALFQTPLCKQFKDVQNVIAYKVDSMISVLIVIELNH